MSGEWRQLEEARAEADALRGQLCAISIKAIEAML
jgi:hypothetical protein